VGLSFFAFNGLVWSTVSSGENTLEEERILKEEDNDVAGLVVGRRLLKQYVFWHLNETVCFE
jgi:hypothetical protein